MIGISVDSVWANKAFAEHLRLGFPVLSDSNREVAKAYGVLDQDSGVARRTTFVIDQDGIVRHIDQGKEAMDPSAAIAACPVPGRK